MDTKIFKEVDQYIQTHFAPEDEALTSTIRAIGDAGMEQGSISPNQGKFLQVMAAACNAKNMIELGTLGGYSTIWMARALPADGKLISIECDEKHAEVAAKNIANAGLQSRVEIRVGKALDVLQQLEKENRPPFDFIFIDADKPPYAEYLHGVIRLSRPGTIIVFDNVIRMGKILDNTISDEVVNGVQRFNKALAECSEVTATIVPTFGIKDYDGMAIAVVK